MPQAALIRNSRVTPSPTLRELAAILFRQSRFVTAAFVLVSLSTLLYAFVSAQYEARLKVMLRRGRVDPVVSPQAATLADYSRHEISEEELNSEVELMRDEDLLRHVVVESGLVPAGTSERSARVERVARELGRTLTVEPLRKSNLIAVRYRAASAKEAARVLSSLSTAYVQKHADLQRPSGESGFFERQTAEYEQRLHDSEARLVDFGRNHNVASPTLERDIALQKLGEAEAAYRQLDQDRIEAERRSAALREQLKSFQARSVTQQRWADNPQLLEKLKTHLLELQLKRTELLTRYEPSYRLVQEVDHEIAETKQSIAAEALTPVRDETTDKDPNYEWARIELEKSQVQEQSVRAKLAVSSEQIASLRATAQERQSDSVAQDDLVRTAKAEEDSYLLYRRKREEARIGDALDEQRILNVAVVEAPVASALPIHSMVFWLAVAVGLAVPTSVAAGFTAEYFDPTIRTPNEALTLLEVPTLAWLPSYEAEQLEPKMIRIDRKEMKKVTP
jgi:uncharacterized protein involved in exopolysaccharide biosynthesis